MSNDDTEFAHFKSAEIDVKHVKEKAYAMAFSTQKRALSNRMKSSGKATARDERALRARGAAIFAEFAATAEFDLAMQLTAATYIPVSVARAHLRKVHRRRLDKAAAKSWDRAFKDFTTNAP